MTITSPANGTKVQQGASVSFSGTASDAEDGNLAANLAWTSSLDGAIGTGATFSTTGLAVGSHTVSAAVTDSGGLTGIELDHRDRRVFELLRGLPRRLRERCERLDDNRSLAPRKQLELCQPGLLFGHARHVLRPGPGM